MSRNHRLSILMLLLAIIGLGLYLLRRDESMPVSLSSVKSGTGEVAAVMTSPLPTGIEESSKRMGHGDHEPVRSQVIEQKKQLGEVTVTVVDEESLETVEGIVVRVHRYRPGVEGSLLRQVKTDPKGHARFELSTASYRFYAGDCPSDVVKIEPGQALSTTIHVSRLQRFSGKVSDPMGFPVQGAGVYLFVTRNGSRETYPCSESPAAITDENGCFTVATAGYGMRLGARAPGYRDSDLHSGRYRNENGVRSVHLILRAAPRTISVRTVDARHAPIGDVELFLAPLSSLTRPRPLEVRYHPTRIFRTDSNGLATVEGVGDGRHKVIAKKPGFHIVRDDLDLGPMGLESQSPDVTTIVMTPCKLLAGKVVNSEGKGMEGLDIRLLYRGYGPGMSKSRQRSGPGGRFCFSSLPRTEEAYLQVMGKSIRSKSMAVNLEEACKQELKILVSPALLLTGRAIDASGKALSGFQIQATPKGGRRIDGGLAGIQVDGSFTIKVKRDMPHVMSVRPRHSPIPFKSRKWILSPGVEGNILVLQEAVEQLGSLRGFVVDLSGIPMKRAGLRLSHGRHMRSAGITGAVDGAFELDGLPEGDYRLTILPEQSTLPPVSFGPFKVMAGQRLDCGQLVLRGLGRFTASIVLGEGVGHAYACLLAKDTGLQIPIPIRNGKTTTLSVSAGRYEFRVSSREAAPHVDTVVIHEGKQTTRALELSTIKPIHVKIGLSGVLPEGLFGGSLSLTNAKGMDVIAGQPFRFDKSGFGTIQLRIHPGDYRVHVLAHTPTSKRTASSPDRPLAWNGKLHMPKVGTASPTTLILLPE